MKTGSRSSALLGVWIGDSFIELSAPAESPLAARGRWFLPKKSWADALKEALRALKPEMSNKTSVRILFDWCDLPPNRVRRSSGAACLVNSGFESLFQDGKWLADDRVIPMEEDLESLSAKLLALKVTDVALCLSADEVSREREQKTAAFLTSKGLRTFTAHSQTGSGLSARWVRAIDRATRSAFLEEQLATLREILASEAPEIETHLSCAHGFEPCASAGSREWTGGVGTLLAERAKANGSAILAHFGLERFHAATPTATKLLSLQPTGQIGATSWFFPSWLAEDRGFEPGPMLFGKSHQLTYLDVLYVREKLKSSIEAFSERINEKSRARILETLFTLGKKLAAPGRSAVDAQQMAEDLEKSAAELIVADLSRFSLKPGDVVELSGPLAHAVAPSLARVSVPWTWRLDEADDYSLADAVRGADA